VASTENTPVFIPDDTSQRAGRCADRMLLLRVMTCIRRASTLSFRS